MRNTHATKRRPVRFRLIVLLAALGLVASLYLLLRQDRLDSDLQDGVMLGDANRVHAALHGGANARGVVTQTSGPSPIERLLHGQNPFVDLAPPIRVARAGKPTRGPVDGNTLLIYAAETRSVRILEDLIEHGADIEARGANGTTAVFLCVSKDGRQCLDVLLRHGAKVNVQNEGGQTPLHIAAGADSVEAVRVLLDHGGELQLKDHKGATPLIVAARAHAANSCLVLLDRGGNPADIRDPVAALPMAPNAQTRINFNDATPVPALAWAAAKGGVPLMERLWQGLLTPEERRTQGPRALFQAVLAKQPESVAYLLKRGVSPNARIEATLPSEFGRRIRLSTIRPTTAATTRSLTASSGIPSVITQHYWLPSPLSIAASNRDIGMCKFLLAHGAAINGVVDGFSPLTAAIQSEAKPDDIFTRIVPGRANPVFDAPKRANRYPTVRFLLTKGADVRYTSSWGMTALMTAVQDASLVDLLLSKGADARAKLRGGQTALMYACSANVLSVERLLAAGAEVNDSDAQGVTPLMYAMRNYRPGEAVRTVRLLLKHGADPNARDKRMHTVLMYTSPTTLVVYNNGIRTQTKHVNELDALLKQAGARVTR